MVIIFESTNVQQTGCSLPCLFLLKKGKGKSSKSSKTGFQTVFFVANGQLLTIQTQAGVKHIKIEYEKNPQSGADLFYFTETHKFSSLNKLIDYYRKQDLGDVFNYTHMKGMKLNNPYKNV